MRAFAGNEDLKQVSIIGTHVWEWVPEEVETGLDIPRVLGHVTLLIAERYRLLEDQQKWFAEFLEAIPAGADLSGVWPKFAEWLLVDRQDGIIKYANTKRMREPIIQAAKLYHDLCNDNEKWVAVRKATSDEITTLAAVGDEETLNWNPGFLALTTVAWAVHEDLNYGIVRRKDETVDHLLSPWHAPAIAAAMSIIKVTSTESEQETGMAIASLKQKEQLLKLLREAPQG
jgi:hypothetical protein